MSNKEQFLHLIKTIPDSEFNKINYGVDDWCACILDFPEAVPVLQKKPFLQNLTDWSDLISHRNPEKYRQKALNVFC